MAFFDDIDFDRDIFSPRAQIENLKNSIDPRFHPHTDKVELVLNNTIYCLTWEERVLCEKYLTREEWMPVILVTFFTVSINTDIDELMSFMTFGEHADVYIMIKDDADYPPLWDHPIPCMKHKDIKPHFFRLIEERKNE